MSIWRSDAEAETPILWPPDAKNRLIGKDPDAGKDWRQEKGMTEDKMVGWHHRCDGHEFEQAPGVGDGQGSLACCSPWGRKESGMSNWTELNWWANEGFPRGTSGKESNCQCRRHKRLGFNPWVGKISWRRYGNPLQHSCLENPLDRGAWWATVHGLEKSPTGLSNSVRMHKLMSCANSGVKPELWRAELFLRELRSSGRNLGGRWYVAEMNQ